MEHQELLKKTLKAVAVMLLGSTLFLGTLGGITVAAIGYATSGSQASSQDDVAGNSASTPPPARGSKGGGSAPDPAKRPESGRPGTQI